MNPTELIESAAKNGLGIVLAIVNMLLIVGVFQWFKLHEANRNKKEAEREHREVEREKRIADENSRREERILILLESKVTATEILLRLHDQRSIEAIHLIMENNKIQHEQNHTIIKHLELNANGQATVVQVLDDLKNELHNGLLFKTVEEIRNEVRRMPKKNNG